MSSVEAGLVTSSSKFIASLYVVTNVCSLVFTAVVSFLRLRVAADDMVSIRLRVTPPMASVTVLLLLVISTPSTVNAASAALTFVVLKHSDVGALLDKVNVLSAPSGPVTMML